MAGPHGITRFYIGDRMRDLGGDLRGSRASKRRCAESI